MRRTHRRSGRPLRERLERLVIADRAPQVVGPGGQQAGHPRGIRPGLRRAARGRRSARTRTRTAGSTTDARAGRAPAPPGRRRGSSRRPSARCRRRAAGRPGPRPPDRSRAPSRVAPRRRPRPDTGSSSRWPTIRPVPSTATSDRQPSGASARIASTIVGLLGPAERGELDVRIPGSSPGASNRIETWSGGGASDAGRVARACGHHRLSRGP